MDRDNQSNRRWTDSTERRDSLNGVSNDRDTEIMSAYDDIDGTPMFIIAAVDSDQAWIGISDDGEVDTTEWR